MDLQPIGLEYRARYQILGGPAFLGQILDPPDTSRVSNFLSARRYLRTTPKTLVKLADVILVDGSKYIVADHGKGFDVKPIYQHFKIFEVDNEVIWQRATFTVNPVTGLKGGGVPTNLGIAYLSTITKNDLEDAINIPFSRSIYITDKPIVVDDILGDRIVTKVDKMLGVYIAEVKTR